MFQKNSSMLPKICNSQALNVGYVKTKIVLPVILLSMVASVSIAAPSDVPHDHWAKNSVDTVTSKQIMTTDNGKFDGNKPVTRYELAVTLDKWTKYIEKGRTPLSHPVKKNRSSLIPAKAPKEVKVALMNLASWDFIDEKSILLKGTGKEVVTADQLSDIISRVIVRLSDRAEPPHAD